jgi:hypothetical protein
LGIISAITPMPAENLKAQGETLVGGAVVEDWTSSRDVSPTPDFS